MTDTQLLAVAYFSCLEEKNAFSWLCISELQGNI